MNTEQKYYVPSIEDIWINYEWEFRPWDWKNDKFRDEWKLGRYRKEKSLHKLQEKYIATGNLRVKYLDKQDIESEGWIFQCVEPGTFEIQKFRMENNKIKGADFDTWYKLTASLEFGKPTIAIYTEDTDCIYKGECKSINELRKLMKWLQIK